MSGRGWLIRALASGSLPAEGQLQVVRVFEGVTTVGTACDVFDGSDQLACVILDTPEEWGWRTYRLIHVTRDRRPLLTMRGLANTDATVDLHFRCLGVHSPRPTTVAQAEVVDAAGFHVFLGSVTSCGNRLLMSLRPGHSYRATNLRTVPSRGPSPEIFITHATRLVRCAGADQIATVAPVALTLRDELDDLPLGISVSITLVVTDLATAAPNVEYPMDVFIECCDPQGRGLYIIFAPRFTRLRQPLEKDAVYAFRGFRVAFQMGVRVLHASDGHTIEMEDRQGVCWGRLTAAYQAARSTRAFHFLPTIQVGGPARGLENLRRAASGLTLEGVVVGFRALVTAVDLSETVGPRCAVLTLADAEQSVDVVLSEDIWAEMFRTFPVALVDGPLDVWVDYSAPAVWDEPLPVLRAQRVPHTDEWRAFADELAAQRPLGG
ncbi:MAG: hypothetical protein LBS56_09480 [Propionibacteriaceae bacterium]|jgi:hypothetical protein|nr:hypothetical protein [Propionibacteriaceae bacterium]